MNFGLLLHKSLTDVLRQAKDSKDGTFGGITNSQYGVEEYSTGECHFTATRINLEDENTSLDNLKLCMFFLF